MPGQKPEMQESSSPVRVKLFAHETNKNIVSIFNFFIKPLPIDLTQAVKLVTCQSLVRQLLHVKLVDIKIGDYSRSRLKKKKSSPLITLRFNNKFNNSEVGRSTPLKACCNGNSNTPDSSDNKATITSGF